MADKVFTKQFASDFQGISGQASAIEKDTNFVNRAVNYEFAVGNSLRGRVGNQIAGTAGQFFGLFPYSYTRTQDEYKIVYDAGNTLSTSKTAADGATIQKLIGINQQMWVLDTMDIVVTYVSGTYPFTIYTTVSGSGIRFKIFKTGSGTAVVDSDRGNGISTSGSIWSLLNTIDATGELAVSRTTRGVCPPFALVNGAQNTASTPGADYTWGQSYVVTVLNTPHNFYPGDIITFLDISGSFSYLVGGIVVARTNTTITYVGPPVTVANGQTLGYMQNISTAFPISTVQTVSSGNLTLSFPYWRYIPEGDQNGLPGFAGILNYGYPFYVPFLTWQNRLTTATNSYAPPCATSLNGNLYIGTACASGAGTSFYANNLLKTDSLTLVRAGLPTGPTIANTLPGGAGALNGTYRYKAFFRRVDAQGNIIDGNPGTISTIAAVAEPVGITISMTGVKYSDSTGFQGRSCYKYTAESPAAGVAFSVDDGSGAPGLNAFIQPGDPICLLDNVAPVTGSGVGTLHRTVCTFYDGTTAPSSIKVADSSGYTIPNDSHISTGLTVVVLRTTAGGNQYYVLCEVPVNGYANFPTFNDNVADTALVTLEQYTEVEIGKEHNPPPACSILCEHQGGLVVARGFGTPNTVSFSTEDGIEYFPTASNSFDIPSTQVGPITAIASDTIDRLAVFKEKAYYDVTGDLDAGAFQVNVKNQGDYGISSQASLVRIGNSLLGLCKAGWMVIQDGFLDPYKFQDVSARLINQNYYFQWATAVNDYFNRQYLCSIPRVSGEPVTYLIDYGRNSVKALERSDTTQIDPVGGMAMIGDTLYHLSSTAPYGVFRRLYRFNGDSPGSGNGDSFIDNTNAISYILETQPLNLGEPGQFKSPVRIGVWSIPNDYVIDGWVPFSVLIEDGRTPLAQYVGSGGTNNSSTTLTFSAATDVYKQDKVIKAKGKFYIVRFTTNTIRTAPFLTGYEIMFAADYEKEDLDKK